MTIKSGARQLISIENGEQKILVTVRMDDAGILSFEGEAEMIDELKAGLQDPVTGERITPEDGPAFFGTLELVYDGPYLFVVSP